MRPSLMADGQFSLLLKTRNKDPPDKTLAVTVTENIDIINLQRKQMIEEEEEDVHMIKEEVEN